MLRGGGSFSRGILQTFGSLCDDTAVCGFPKRRKFIVYNWFIMKNYQDILYLPHHVSNTRKQMPTENRAAQFAPFAALTGYDEAIDETVRTTDECVALDEDEAELLDYKLQLLVASLSDTPNIKVTYFVPDARKSGGAYHTKEGDVLSVDLQKGTLTFADRTTLVLASVCDLDGEIFDETQRSVD